MEKEAVIDLADDVMATAQAGVDQVGVSKLRRNLEPIQSQAKSDPSAAPLHEDLQTTLDAEADEVPLPLLDLMQGVLSSRTTFADAGNFRGELKEIADGGFWTTDMPAEDFYRLVPETRPFAKRAKPPEQVEVLESTARRGVVNDMRLYPLYLKSLTEKAGAVVADAMARVALPSFGPAILPDLWPSLGPENRTFVTAYQIDPQATLARLMEKTNKKSDKSGSVTKAVKKLMDASTNDGTTIGPETLPLFKLALKHAPEPAFRHEIAEALARMGPAASDALPELIGAFEHMGLHRDWHMIRPMIVLGKNSEDVAESLMRGLQDRDNVVRLISAFNLGQMGPVSFSAMPILEDLSEVDQDAKVRDQALKTLNKLRIRQAILNPPPEETPAAEPDNVVTEEPENETEG